MSEPQQNQDEELREFESAANKEAIERENALDDARRTCLELRIEIEQWKQRAEKAEADAVELRDALKRLIPFAQSYRSHPLRNPEDKLDSALEKCQHALSSDCGKDYIHREISVNKLVDAFVACPLPDSVCSDHCACIRGYKHRSGTNLLSVEEARQMFTQILESLRKESKCN